MNTVDEIKVAINKTQLVQLIFQPLQALLRIIRYITHNITFNKQKIPVNTYGSRKLFRGLIQI